MPIDFYYAKFSPPSRVVLMALKELNIEPNIKTLDVQNGEHLKPEFLKINPAHTIPTIVDGDLILWESRAILQYLVNKYALNSSLYPSDPKKRAVVDKMLNIDFSLSNALKDVFVNLFTGTEATEQQKTTLENNLKLLETLIGDNKYVTGDELTIADLSILVNIHSLKLNDFKDIKDLPKVKNWYERLREELPSFEEVNGGVIEMLQQMIASKKK